ncbi:MAG: tRNA pseudouridine synthase [Candidatus Saccharibacteria bacterium]|nr:tRNA pseudouridine synthase [Candidatus Saccharibacteria bacterium]
MDGLLLIDKPKGWTSFDVVAKVRGILKQSGVAKPKVGHTGTLDPLATGLLVLCLGSYCKRASEFSKLDKTYEVTMKLGQTSTTGDEEGEITAVSVTQPTPAALTQALGLFTGELEQTPPIYSAIKVNGQRAYKLAREGKAVKLEPRLVKIYSIHLTSYNYPEVIFTASVSSGTYIRSLATDIGQTLGTGAYLTQLRRTKVGQFSIEYAQPMPELSAENIYASIIVTN